MAPRPPVAYRYTALDEKTVAMVPLNPRFQAICDRHFVVGEVYTLADFEPRSMTSHNHEFAWLAEAWRNLPERLSEQYPTPEHLRKRALIEAGYFDQTIVDAGSKAAALRVAAFIRSSEEFTIVVVSRHLVLVRRAQSQSLRAMGAKRFQESKTAILEIVSELVGIEPEKLKLNAGKSA